MTLPVPPTAETILRNAITTLDQVLLPAVGKDEWAKFNAGLLIGALEYALDSMKEDRAARHRASLQAVLDDLQPGVASSGSPELLAALQEASPFEAATRLLVWGQNNPGALALVLQHALRRELHAQLEEELKASAPIMGAFQKGMRGEL